MRRNPSFNLPSLENNSPIWPVETRLSIKSARAIDKRHKDCDALQCNWLFRFWLKRIIN